VTADIMCIKKIVAVTFSDSNQPNSLSLSLWLITITAREIIWMCIKC